jgi:hypothetical protein
MKKNLAILTFELCLITFFAEKCRPCSLFSLKKTEEKKKKRESNLDFVTASQELKEKVSQYINDLG